MIKLTKAERHKRYKRALRDIESEQEEFMCTALMDMNCSPAIYSEDVLKVFPELAKKKPKYKGYVWFTNPIYKINKAERVKILKKCIKETKPKSNGVSKRGGSTKRKSLHPVSKRTRGKLAVVRRVRKKSKTR